MDKIWDRKSFEVGGHWPLWRGWKKRMNTQNRQKLNAKKKRRKKRICWCDVYCPFNVLWICKTSTVYIHSTVLKAQYNLLWTSRLYIFWQPSQYFSFCSDMTSCTSMAQYKDFERWMPELYLLRLYLWQQSSTLFNSASLSHLTLGFWIVLYRRERRMLQ